eukprot:2854238-Rhodomonas_salina.1
MGTATSSGSSASLHHDSVSSVMAFPKFPFCARTVARWMVLSVGPLPLGSLFLPCRPSPSPPFQASCTASTNPSSSEREGSSGGAATATVNRLSSSPLRKR